MKINLVLRNTIWKFWDVPLNGSQGLTSKKNTRKRMSSAKKFICFKKIGNVCPLSGKEPETAMWTKKV